MLTCRRTTCCHPRSQCRHGRPRPRMLPALSSPSPRPHGASRRRALPASQPSSLCHVGPLRRPPTPTRRHRSSLAPTTGGGLRGRRQWSHPPCRRDVPRMRGQSACRPPPQVPLPLVPRPDGGSHCFQRWRYRPPGQSAGASWSSCRCCAGHPLQLTYPSPPLCFPGRSPHSLSPPARLPPPLLRSSTGRSGTCHA